MAPGSLVRPAPYEADPFQLDASSSPTLLLSSHSSVLDVQKRIANCEVSESSNATEDCQTAHQKLPEVKTWKSLPDDIKYNILAKLSYLNIYRAKTQSKEFKDLIERKEFHNWRFKAQGGKAQEGLLTALYFFIRDGIWHCEGYDLITTSWMRLPPFTKLPLPDPDTFKDHSFCFADSLICANVGRDQEQLIVFNALTGAYRQLPRLHHRRSPVLMHLIAYPKENYYKLIVAGSARRGDEHLSKKTEVYDSRTKTWKVTDELPGPLFALNEHQAGVFVDGCLYCIAFLEGDCGKGVIPYSVEKGRWLRECTSPLPDATSSNIVQLVQSDGEVYLFSEIEQERRVEHRIDVLDRALLQWRSVMSETRAGNPGLQTYPEYTCVPFGDGKLCVFNTIEHHGVGYEVKSGRRCEPLVPPARSACAEMSFFSLNPLTFAFAPNFQGVEP